MPIPWGRAKRLRGDHLDQLSVESYRTGGKRKRTAYRIIAWVRGATKGTLVDDLTHDEATFIELELERRLRIVDRSTRKPPRL